MLWRAAAVPQGEERPKHSRWQLAARRDGASARGLASGATSAVIIRCGARNRPAPARRPYRFPPAPLPVRFPFPAPFGPGPDRQLLPALGRGEEERLKVPADVEHVAADVAGDLAPI